MTTSHAIAENSTAGLLTLFLGAGVTEVSPTGQAASSRAN